ncbi:nucleotidyltransferase domain-containing protein [Salinisphaera hydrothermalis]|uniref:DNA polymerase subunit beta n=1 Tax=Salinisphaera hydrothermalis (strain C41B8) TaxID=1304275 RepID=A0A084IQ31_SALHC|nr:nucleotidyltransferase domain-containing protein [Salinisphaera hydrothermalis]KEZ78815.1 DNA polymerase subunit beta [Salinisphaera hydrothermalis C41B8]
MRLSSEQASAIRRIIAEESEQRPAQVRLFGSRLDDNRRGGDLDLLVKLDNPVAHPAWLAARLEARISRFLEGRDVDVLLSAPNLRHAGIHQIAERDGVPL